jgi:hypothetical protein
MSGAAIDVTKLRPAATEIKHCAMLWAARGNALGQVQHVVACNVLHNVEASSPMAVDGVRF